MNGVVFIGSNILQKSNIIVTLIFFLRPNIMFNNILSNLGFEKAKFELQFGRSYIFLHFSLLFFSTLDESILKDVLLDSSFYSSYFKVS